MARLGLRAAAKAVGISHVALLRATKDGRVHRADDGTYDVEQCRADLKHNSHTGKQLAARTQQRSGLAPQSQDSPAPPADKTAPDGKSYSEAVRVQAWLKVARDQMALKLRQGQLVELAAINAFCAGQIIRARDELIHIGPELRDRLASEIDPVRIEAMITERVAHALNNLAEYKPPA